VLRVRTRQANLLLGITVAVVLAVIVLAWRPWADGAQDRITTSGLVPVLTLLLGQLVTLAVSASTTEQSLLLRRYELEHEGEMARGAAIRQDRLRAEEQEAAANEDVRQRFLEVIRAASALGPALSNAIVLTYRADVQMPSEELTQARVALFNVVPLLDEVEDLHLAGKVKAALESLTQLNASLDDSSFTANGLTAIEQLDIVQFDIANSRFLE
jgi:hypothetical protein